MTHCNGYPRTPPQWLFDCRSGCLTARVAVLPRMFGAGLAVREVRWACFL